MGKIRDKVLAKINSLEHRDLKDSTFHKAIADYTQTLFEAQQKEVERLKEELKQCHKDKAFYSEQWEEQSKINTQLKQQIEKTIVLLEKYLNN